MLNKRGRPPGRPETRRTIADAARELFLERGYRATTVRAVAERAGVDSALISYHFGSKQGLFGEVMQLRCAHSDALTKALDGDRAGLADRLVRAVTDGWDDTGINHASHRDEDVMRLLREYLDQQVLTRIAEFLGGPDATARATAAVTIIGGLIYTRYLNPLPGPARLTAAQVHRMLTPALRAALTRPPHTLRTRQTGSPS